MTQTLQRLGDRVETAVGIVSMPPDAMVTQADSIADAIGAPRVAGFRWHSMWLQTMRSLESTPAAILFRSTRPLSSGSPMDDERSMALSYVNRMIATIARAGIAAGVDGLFIETHFDPSNAKSDGANMLDIKLLKKLLTDLTQIRKVLNQL